MARSTATPVRNYVRRVILITLAALALIVPVGLTTAAPAHAGWGFTHVYNHSSSGFIGLVHTWGEGWSCGLPADRWSDQWCGWQDTDGIYTGKDWCTRIDVGGTAQTHYWKTVCGGSTGTFTRLTEENSTVIVSPYYVGPGSSW